MKAAAINRYGKPFNLRVQNLPKPQPKPDEILVKIKASSVNPIDWKIRQGSLQIISGWNFPKILGADFSGVVETVGEDIGHLKAGDQVFGMISAAKGGAYAEYLVVKAENLVLKPTEISYQEAAAVPLAGLTALQGLKKAQIAAGHKVLVNGASGGVGHYAVQVAKAYGADVTGVAGPSRAQMVKALGADAYINYKNEAVLPAQPTYDIIYDAHGNLPTDKVEAALNPGGHYISTLPSASVIFSKLKAKFGSDKHFSTIWITVNTTDLSELKLLLEEGKLKSVIEKSFALDDIDEAHQLSEAGHVGGKVVVTM